MEFGVLGEKGMESKQSVKEFFKPLRETKKKKVPPLVAGPLRGGEGGKGRATKEKRTFFKTFFLFCCHLKIKIILL